MSTALEYQEAGTTYTLSRVSIDHSFNGVDVRLRIPATVVQEKLSELGYQILGGNQGRDPVLLRGADAGQAMSFDIENVASVRITVGALQNVLHRLHSLWDIYDSKGSPEDKAKRWWK